MSFAYVWTGPIGEGLHAADRVGAVSGGDPNRGTEIFSFSPLDTTYLGRAFLCALLERLDDARRWADQAVETFRHRSEVEWLAWSLSIYPPPRQLPS